MTDTHRSLRPVLARWAASPLPPNSLTKQTPLPKTHRSAMIWPSEGGVDRKEGIDVEKELQKWLNEGTGGFCDTWKWIIEHAPPASSASPRRLKPPLVASRRIAREKRRGSRAKRMPLPHVLVEFVFSWASHVASAVFYFNFIIYSLSSLPSVLF